jgi:hypothetical protein
MVTMSLRALKRVRRMRGRVRARLKRVFLIIGLRTSLVKPRML